MNFSRHIITSAFIAAAIVAPVSVQAQARQVAGTYTTVINSPQGPIKAILVLKRDATGAYSGTMAPEGFPLLTLTSIVASETGVVVEADMDGALTVTIKFATADKVTGSVLYQGMDMGLEGSFVPASASAPPGGTGARER